MLIVVASTACAKPGAGGGGGRDAAVPSSDAATGDDAGPPDSATTFSNCDLVGAWKAVSATASSQAALAQAAIDGDLTTAFVSDAHLVAQNAESISILFDQPRTVNVVALAPRIANGTAVGFPVELGIAWFDGAQWNDARGFTHYPTPTSAACVTLPLPDPVQARGIRVTARVLGKDGGSYDLSLAELVAGNDPARSGAFVTPTQATASSVATPATSWAAANAVDGNLGTVWSSATHSAAASAESLSLAWSATTTFNQVKLVPRYDAGGHALGFPTAFTISSVQGGTVTALQSYVAFPTPHRGDALVLPLPGAVMTAQLRIDATTLGSDDVGNFVFQLAEVSAGYDPGFERFRFTGNNGAVGVTEIDSVGSEPVDRADQLQHWDYDVRDVVIAPSAGTLQNIYAPSVIYAGGATWQIFFGGWDGSSTGNDRIYRTTTSDGFATFGPHALVIDHGVFQHTNNDCALQVGPNDFRMMYTTYDGTLNKPATSRSSDGVTWSPNAGTTSTLISMTGYAGWANADVNGGNVIHRDAAGLWHLYFIDFKNFPGIHHATSTDFVSYTYVGRALPDAMVPNDWKAFAYGGTTYYVGAYHDNTQKIWMSVGTSLDTPPSPIVAFTNAGSADKYMVAVGLVQDGQRLYGALYGAGAVSTLDQNRIFAEWLQKKVVFSNANVRWGDIERSQGPDKVLVLTADPASVETGRFDIYDTDGTTLLYRSPVVTMRTGDTWRYDRGY